MKNEVVDTGLGEIDPLKNHFYSYIKSHSDMVIVNFGIVPKPFEADFEKIRKNEPYDSLTIIELLQDSKDLKSRCKSTFSKETLKVHNSIKV